MHAPLADTLRRKALPWLVWAGLVAGAFFAWRNMGSGLAVRGFAEANPYRLSAIEPARVEAVLVQVGDRVQAGQVVAVLDARAIDGELRAVEADKARVIAEIARAELEARATRTDALRGLTGTRADVERSQREATTRLETARAELAALKAELARQRQAVADGLLRAADLADLEIRQVALTRNITEETAAVRLYEARLASTTDLGAPDEAAWVEAAVAPLRAEAQVFEGHARALEVRRDQHVLRAPADGQVSAVSGRADSIVTPQVPLVEIMPDAPGRIVACVGDDVGVAIHVGQVVLARPATARDPELRGRAVSVGPVVELPMRCWRDPRLPLWGQLVTVELTPPVTLVPGEPFEVRFESDGG